MPLLPILSAAAVAVPEPRVQWQYPRQYPRVAVPPCAVAVHSSDSTQGACAVAVPKQQQWQYQGACAVAVPKALVQAPSVSEDEDGAELIVPDGEGGASVGDK